MKKILLHSMAVVVAFSLTGNLRGEEAAAPQETDYTLAQNTAQQEAERRAQEQAAPKVEITTVEATEVTLHPGTSGTDQPATTDKPGADPASTEATETIVQEVSEVVVDPDAVVAAAEISEGERTIQPFADASAPATGTAQPSPETPQSTPAVDQSVASTPTGNVVVNLINKLVERGVITQDDAKSMVTQAQAEADAQKVQNESDMFAIAQIAAVQTMTDQALAQQGGQGGMSAVEASRREMEASMRVTYIPAPVREQLAAEIRRELAADGVTVAGGAPQPPPGLPTLLSKLKPEGEIRMRYEADLYPEGNDATGAFPNFNAINSGQPFQINGNQFAPQWNTDQNRNRYRLLLRLGTGIELGDNFSAGFRLASGDNNSPVTANQSIGLPPSNQQGGQFSKYAIWIERAFIRYDLGGGTDEAGMALWVGRFDNPFFSTPIIFDNDLGFDGAAIRVAYNHDDAIIPSVVAGAFPVFNTALNFSSNTGESFPSYDKYLFGIQGGTQVNITRNWSTQLAAAYYYFYNIEGKLSSPYEQYSQNDAGDTDNSRPSFAQKGNTYRPLRNIVIPAGQDPATWPQYQYYGLATPFQNLAFTGKLNYDGWDPVRIALVGEFIRNMAFNSSDINQVAVNNRGEVNPNDTNPDTNEFGAFEGDPNAWLVDLEVGSAELDKLGAWQFSFGYRWIGSDAVVDGFNDSDFGLGGANMKGFTVAGRLALSPHVYMGLRWFGSESIAGPQFDMNIFQVDLGAKF
jgi:polyhydroxyalkanoate synthesis regulator phasin